MPRPIRVVPVPTATVAFRDILGLSIAVLVTGMILGAAAWVHMPSASQQIPRGRQISPTRAAPTKTQSLRGTPPSQAGQCPAGPVVDRMASIPGGHNAAAATKRKLAEVIARMKAVHVVGKRAAYVASKSACRAIVDDVNTAMYPFIVFVGPFPTERDAVGFCVAMGYAPAVNHYRDCLPKHATSR